MLTLDTLDTVIAVVVVLLVLSLIVQSIQSFIKKLFKIKSGTILTSLKDLFTYMDVSSTGKSPEQLVQDVTVQLKEIGRVSAFGNLMIDSIAQGDLEKILKKLGHEDLLGKVDTWFATVMQSFEERYTRHMKTVAVILSFAVVIFLNANFFEVYRKISGNGPVRAAIVKKGEELDKRLKERPANPPAGDQTDLQLKAEVEQLKKETAAYVANYQEFGFEPFTRQQLKDYFSAEGPWHRDANPPNRFLYALKSLIGWTIMALLLSVGAPFWQDALESLFGIKNLLRKRSDTKNVEDKGGQPKP